MKSISDKTRDKIIKLNKPKKVYSKKMQEWRCDRCGQPWLDGHAKKCGWYENLKKYTVIKYLCQKKINRGYVQKERYKNRWQKNTSLYKMVPFKRIAKGSRKDTGLL